MVLNLLRSEVYDPDTILQKSFRHFVDLAEHATDAKRRLELESHISNATSSFPSDICDIKEVEKVFKLYELLAEHMLRVRTITMKPKHSLKFFQPGRLVRVGSRSVDQPFRFIDVFDDGNDNVVVDSTNESPRGKSSSKVSGLSVPEIFVKRFVNRMNAEVDLMMGIDHEDGAFGWGIVVNCFRDFCPDIYAVDVLVFCEPVDIPSPSKSPSPTNAHVVRVSMSLLECVSALRVYMPDDLSDQRTRVELLRNAHGLIQGFQQSGKPIPTLCIDSDLHAGVVDGVHVRTLLERIESLKHRIRSSKVISNLSDDERLKVWSAFARVHALQSRLKGLKNAEQSSELQRFRTELKNRIRLLRRLNYVDANDVVLQKGKLACEIESLDEV